MHYEEQARRLGILGGFALGIAVGAGAALLVGGRRRASPAAAVTRARRARVPRGGRVEPATDGAAGRMARKKFKL